MTFAAPARRVETFVEAALRLGTFVEAALRLAGLAGVTFGWAPDLFWNATPAELAALVGALRGDAPGIGADELARLMEACPDG